ncbi:MAG: phage terminase large subunit family protein, partial [Synergistales bacterium]|nr:phage terminase large subunit family protein [Synergistales bacterium]
MALRNSHRSIRQKSLTRLCRRILTMTAPPPTLTVSEWADNYRRLSNEYAPEPGQWRTERAPYQRELMDCSADPRVRKVSIMAAAQTGKT